MTEHRDVSLWNDSLREFRKRIARATPTPGGGAVAAVAASLAAALLRMVCSIVAAKKPDAGIDEVAVRVKQCEEELARFADQDIRVFDRYMAARRLGGASAHAEIQRCLLECAEVPLAAAEAVAKLQSYGAEIALHSPEFLWSDVATARHLLDASRKSLLANVSINLTDLEDGEAKRMLSQRIEALDGNTT